MPEPIDNTAVAVTDTVAVEDKKDGGAEGAATTVTTDTTAADTTTTVEDKDLPFDESEIDEEVRNYIPPAKETSDDDDIDPEEKQRLEKIVENKYGSDIDNFKKKLELDTYFAENPEMTRYRKAVEIYKKHPTYAGVPVNNIALMLSAKDSMKIGAAKERAAQAKVNATKTIGDTVRKPSGGTTDWSSMPKDQFEAEKAKILGQGQ